MQLLSSQYAIVGQLCIQTYICSFYVKHNCCCAWRYDFCKYRIHISRLISHRLRSLSNLSRAQHGWVDSSDVFPFDSRTRNIHEHVHQWQFNKSRTVEYKATSFNNQLRLLCYATEALMWRSLFRVSAPFSCAAEQDLKRCQRSPSATHRHKCGDAGTRQQSTRCHRWQPTATLWQPTATRC